jgi:hypothetical protein
VNDRPYLRFHVDELRFDGCNWQVAFTPRGIDWEPKQVRPVPDEEMRRIWKAYGMTVEPDDASVKQHFRMIEGSVKNYLLREYWSLDRAKDDKKDGNKHGKK